MMPDRLPSLSALRVFETAGRLLSFTRAAIELNVSQAAVSHQIRCLEDQLDQKLFVRTTRRLTLTPAGAQLLPAVSVAFSGLEEAVASLKRAQSSLTITATPFFSARWLMPRMPRFFARYPDIEVSIRHTTKVLDLAIENVDLAIRGGGGHWPGLETQLITPFVWGPVASPNYVAAIGLLDHKAIERAVLLHDETREEWAEWLLIAGLDPALAREGPIFDDEHVLMAAARRGHGIALADLHLIAEEIGEGLLVPLHEPSLDATFGYYLAYPRESSDQAKIRAFRDFVLGSEPTNTHKPWGGAS